MNSLITVPPLPLPSPLPGTLLVGPWVPHSRNQSNQSKRNDPYPWKKKKKVLYYSFATEYQAIDRPRTYLHTVEKSRARGEKAHVVLRP
jgi:hypothetical protein